MTLHPKGCKVTQARLDFDFDFAKNVEILGNKISSPQAVAIAVFEDAPLPLVPCRGCHHHSFCT